MQFYREHFALSNWYPSKHSFWSKTQTFCVSCSKLVTNSSNSPDSSCSIFLLIFLKQGGQQRRISSGMWTCHTRNARCLSDSWRHLQETIQLSSASVSTFGMNFLSEIFLLMDWFFPFPKFQNKRSTALDRLIILTSEAYFWLPWPSF